VFVPWIITPLLMLGGAFLCYEGFEKLAHRFLHSKAEDAAEHAERVRAVSDPKVDMVEYEKQRVKGAIRTDAILSAEIIVIALGTVQDETLPIRIGVLATIAAIITVFIYGTVAGIVKLDDVGMHLAGKTGESRFASMQRSFGRLILRFAPWLMKALAVLGTAAMFLVGGGIIVHGIPPLAAFLHGVEEFGHGLPVVADIFPAFAAIVINGVVGIIAGGILVGTHTLFTRLRRKSQ
jgi:predicted DNA repair protein MutK